MRSQLYRVQKQKRQYHPLNTRRTLSYSLSFVNLLTDSLLFVGNPGRRQEISTGRKGIISFDSNKHIFNIIFLVFENKDHKRDSNNGH